MYIFCLANQAAFAGVFEKLGDASCRGGFAGERVDFGARFVQQQVFAVEVVVAALDAGDVLSAEVVAFQAFEVDAGDARGRFDDERVRRNVLFDPGAVADHGVGADAHELVHHRRPAHDDVVFDVDVAGEDDVVGEGGVVTDDAVVREVDVGHDPVAVAEDGLADVLHRAAVEGNELADGVVVADFEGGVFAAVFFILRDSAERSEGEDVVVFADARRPFDNDMRRDGGAASDLYARADDAVGADADVAIEFGFGINECGRVDLAHGGLLCECVVICGKARDVAPRPLLWQIGSSFYSTPSGLFTYTSSAQVYVNGADYPRVSIVAASLAK